jgi:hypothetical protein
MTDNKQLFDQLSSAWRERAVVTKGKAGLRRAGHKAATTKGPEGNRLAAEKAQATRREKERRKRMRNQRPFPANRVVA